MTQKTTLIDDWQTNKVTATQKKTLGGMYMDLFRNKIEKFKGLQNPKNCKSKHKTKKKLGWLVQKTVDKNRTLTSKVYLTYLKRCLILSSDSLRQSNSKMK